MNNIYKRILPVLSCLLAVNAANAQMVEEAEPVPVSQAPSMGMELLTADTVAAVPDTLVAEPQDTIKHHVKRKEKMKRLVERRGMISREDTKTVFIPKGQWMVGGQVAWNQWNDDNLNYLVLKNIDFEAYIFSVGPYFGYFFANNLAVGGRFSYRRYFLDLGTLDLNLGDDLNIGLKDLYYLQHSYETTAFIRSYLPLGKSKIFGLFGEFQLNYTHSEGKNSTGTGDTFTSTYEHVNSFDIAIAGGMVVFITDYVAAEVMLNVGGYRIKWGEQNTNNIETGKILSSGANFRINLFSIKFGVTYYL